MERRLRNFVQGASKHRWRDNVIATGGGPGLMEAANRGAHDAGAPTIGFNIKLPVEQKPNPYITPDLNFEFHYFAMRKMHLAMRANALVIFPGGVGTMDEMFELLTLQQTRKAPPAPIALYDESGFIEGHNILIGWRFAQGLSDRAAENATALVRPQMDATVASDDINVVAAKRATTAIAIVMVSTSNPVGQGFVTSLAHPGGNITGVIQNDSWTVVKARLRTDGRGHWRQAAGTLTF